jgi:hypothetical protein
MNSLLWFVAGMAFGYYFPGIVTKIKETVLGWFDSQSNDTKS